MQMASPPQWMLRHATRAGDRPNTWGSGCAPCLSCEPNRCNRYTPCLVPDAGATPIGELAFTLVMHSRQPLMQSLITDEYLLGPPVGTYARDEYSHCYGKRMANKKVRRPADPRTASGLNGKFGPPLPTTFPFILRLGLSLFRSKVR